MTSTIKNISGINRTVFTPTKGTSASLWGGCYYAKTGNVVQVHLGISGLTASASSVVFTLPAGYRPSGTFHMTGTAGTTSTYCYVDVKDTGEITVFPNGSTNCGADITFIAMN